MQDRIAIFCCNLKPAKMRGIMSEGMIMCGSSPEKVEIIEPPAGSVKGERVIVEGYPGIIISLHCCPLDIFQNEKQLILERLLFTFWLIWHKY